MEKNGKQEAYVRPIAWRGSEMMGVSAQSNTIHLAIATWEWPSYFDPEQRLKGIRLDLADYRRPDPKTAPCRAKAAGLYMICTISKHAAERKGYADAMMLDWQGRVAECTGANIFFVKDGKIHTPIADCFLDGITRQTVIGLAKKRGIEVIERRIMPDELRRLRRMLHHRLGRGSHRGVGDRPVEFQSGRHHQDADGRLHRGSAAEGQGRGGVTGQLASGAWRRPLPQPASAGLRHQMLRLRRPNRNRCTPLELGKRHDAECYRTRHAGGSCGRSSVTKRRVDRDEAVHALVEHAVAALARRGAATARPSGRRRRSRRGNNRDWAGG